MTSRPLCSGITMSSRITSGFSERFWKIASRPLVAGPRLEVDGDPGLLRERLRQPFERGDEAEVVQHFRAQLDREAPDVLERRHYKLTQLGDGGPVLRLLECVLERLQAEQDRR